MTDATEARSDRSHAIYRRFLETLPVIRSVTYRDYIIFTARSEGKRSGRNLRNSSLVNSKRGECITASLFTGTSVCSLFNGGPVNAQGEREGGRRHFLSWLSYIYIRAPLAKRGTGYFIGHVKSAISWRRMMEDEVDAGEIISILLSSPFSFLENAYCA